MKHVRAISALALALILGTAQAQTTSAPGQYPGLNTLAPYVQAGVSITLATDGGRLVAVVNADGTVTIARGAGLREASVAIVKSERGKTLVVLRLAAAIAQNGEVWVSETRAGGRASRVLLAASSAFRGVYTAHIASDTSSGATSSSAAGGTTNASTSVEITSPIRLPGTSTQR